MKLTRNIQSLSTFKRNTAKLVRQYLGHSMPASGSSQRPHIYEIGVKLTEFVGEHPASRV